MITEKTSLSELASIVSETLEDAGIIATLSGGAAVSIYTRNRYVSRDLDFVTLARVDELSKALEPLGFKQTGRPRLSVFEHPLSRWYLEFPPAPLGFGSTYVDPSQCAPVDISVGRLRIITPTQCVMDRLVAAATWNEPQSLEQALLVAETKNSSINWDDLDRWVMHEGITAEQAITEFYSKVGRRIPT